MGDMLSGNWQIFIDQYPQLVKLQRRLAREKWYTDDGWTMFIGPYHEGIFMQVYKPGWYNHTLDGIHIEAGIGVETVRSCTLRLDLHIGHRNLFDRERFNQLTIPRMAEVVAGWGAGCHFSETNLSVRLTMHVPFTKTGFAEQIARELTRWSQLGSIIDDGLARLS